MGGRTLTKIYKQKRARGEKLENLKNSSPSQPVVKRPMTRRSQVVNSEQPQAKGMCNRSERPEVPPPQVLGYQLTLFGPSGAG